MEEVFDSVSHYVCCIVHFLIVLMSQMIIYNYKIVRHSHAIYAFTYFKFPIKRCVK